MGNLSPAEKGDDGDEQTSAITVIPNTAAINATKS
jgi:hypothetical protein